MNKKNLILLCSVLSLLVVLLGMVTVSNTTRLADAEKALTISEQKNNEMTDEVEDLSKNLKEKEDLAKKYETLNTYIDLELLEKEQLQKVQEISTGTDLNYEAAYNVVKYSDIYGIPYSLMLSVIDIESNFDQYSVGGDQDRGYMQIIPSTEKWLAETYGEELELTYDPERIFEPSYNIALGAKYLDLLMNAYGTNYDRILSEYNRGPYNLAAYYEKNDTYATSYSQAIINNEKQYYAYNR